MRVRSAKKRKKEKIPTWKALLQEKFGGIVAGDVAQWVNRRLRLYNTYSEEHMHIAHMDFTTAYTMMTSLASDRISWLLLAKKNW